MTKFPSKDKLSEKDTKRITTLLNGQKARVNGCPVIPYSMARSLGSTKFIYLITNFLNHSHQGIADREFRTNSL